MSHPHCRCQLGRRPRLGGLAAPAAVPAIPRLRRRRKVRAPKHTKCASVIGLESGYRETPFRPVALGSLATSALDHFLFRASCIDFICMRSVSPRLTIYKTNRLHSPCAVAGAEHQCARECTLLLHRPSEIRHTAQMEQIQAEHWLDTLHEPRLWRSRAGRTENLHVQAFDALQRSRPKHGCWGLGTNANLQRSASRCKDGCLRSWNAKCLVRTERCASMAIVPPSPDFQALHSEREGVFHTTIEQVLRRADQVRKVLSVLLLVTPVPGSRGAWVPAQSAGRDCES